MDLGALGDLMGGAGADVSVSVEIDGLGQGPVQAKSVQLEERIGAVTACAVTVGAAAVEDVRDLFGKDAVVRIQRSALAPPRVFRGLVRGGSVVGDPMGGTSLRLELAAGLWLLGQTRDSRVYQDVTVPELVQQVVNELLGDRRYEVRLELAEEYPRHEYLVQHRESHLAFLTRVMAQEGIWYTFDPDPEDDEDCDHEILVLSDANGNRPTFDDGGEGRLAVHSGGGPLPPESAGPLRVGRRLGPTDAVVSGYDWTNPGLAVRSQQPGGTRLPVEVHDHVATSHHDYDGSQYTAHTAERQARFGRERFALSRTSWTLQTTAVNLRAGDLVELTGEDGRFLVLRSTATLVRGRFSNAVTVAPEELPYRPPPMPRPRMQGPETATVVGTGEVHTDLHGRVKVRFHWDRHSESDDKASAWIRVAQPWAGAGHGSVFVPRVGSEVVVGFLGGDADRPVILGSLYNGQNRPPVDLPGSQLRAGFKTSQHELWLDDGGGVALSAGGDMSESVSGGKSVSVGGASSMSYAGGCSMSFAGGSSQSFSGGASTTIDGGETRTVSGGSTVSVSGPSVTSCEGDVASAIVGAVTSKITGSKATEVVGDVTREVQGAVTERVSGAIEQTAESLTQTVRGALQVSATGDASISSTSAFSAVAADARVISHGALALVAQVLETTAAQTERSVTRDTLIAQAATQIVSTRTSAVTTDLLERAVVIERTETSMRELKSSIERVGQDIRQSDVSCAVSNLLLIG